MTLAAEAVNATGELLEQIILSMDTQTLLGTASRVCRRWQHIINTTPSIQKALFFDPERARDDAAEEVPKQTLNPLLLNPNPACFDNPKAFTPPPKPGIFDVNFWPVMGRLGFMSFHELAQNKANLEAVDHPMAREGASWRKMYTSQPPCRTVAVISHRGQNQAPAATCSRPASLSPLSGVFEYEKGMRMGDLYDLTVTHCTQYPVNGFLIISLGGIKK
ncbi:Fc.00g019560.m01.CDS01 [Cosmosporella sp. VM-42]